MNSQLNIPLRMLQLVGTLTVLLVSLLVYLVFLEPPWLIYNNSPFPVLNSPVKPGDAVKMTVARCSTAGVLRVYGLSRTLKGSAAEIVLPAGLAAIKPGCITVVSAVNVIPLGTPAGTYTLHGYGEIQGVIRTSSVAWESQPFEVVPQ